MEAITSQPASLFNTSGTIKDLIGSLRSQQQNLICADKTTTLNQACELLQKHHISSLPIFDQSKNQYIGLVDITDICLLVVFSYSHKLQEGKMNQVNFNDVKLVDLLPITEEGKFAWSFPADETVEDTMEAFSKGVHRAVVQMQEGNTTKHHIISQRDAIQFLLDQHQHEDIFNSKISELPRLFSFQPALVTIDGNTPAIEGFKKIGREHFGAVPVVDDNGRVFASLCATDLSGTDPMLLHTLLLPTNIFLKIIHENKIPRPLTASSDDTLGEVVHRILDANGHRAWVLDGQGKLRGVITLSDVCKVFMRL